MKILAVIPNFIYTLAMPINLTDLPGILIGVFVILFAIAIHEYAHGKSALSLGDPTAKNAGRLTLNPISHIDPIGAICLFLFHFGWAKPVPINTSYFKNPRKDIILTSLSGPMSNFGAAFVSGLFLKNFPLNSSPFLVYLLSYMVLINTALGLFNLLPIPPLDGSHVLENLLPIKAARKFRQAGRHAPLALITLLLMDSFILHINIIGRIIDWPLRFLLSLFV
jgi:Zn-dependent protease